MSLHLKHRIELKNNQVLTISGSKSETNRLFLLQAIFPEISIENSSNADDSKYLKNALNQFDEWKKNGSNPNDLLKIDIHHAGTAMRFLTAFFACQPNVHVVLTGSSRMQERPIKILVNALNDLGAAISYQKTEGFPPLVIKGKNLEKKSVTIHADVSSQYITALMLMAPSLENGLKIQLIGQGTSWPYIKMTLNLLEDIGVHILFVDNCINIVSHHQKLLKKTHHVVESDWSSASYWYGFVALSAYDFSITLKYFKANSLQGDSVLAMIYENFGVKTIFNFDESITLIKTTHTDKNHNQSILNLDLNNCPDIAQTIAVTCFGLGMACHLKGLHTLRIKETDRLEALKNELTKFGADIQVDDDSLILNVSHAIHADVVVKTYQDHRMAMAFAPLLLKTTLTIEDAEVVNKSYPNFWEDLAKL